MNKPLSFALVASLAIVVAGCQKAVAPTPQPSASPTTTASPEPNAQGQSLTEIATSLQTGQAFQCLFTDATQKQQMTYVIQKEKIDMTMVNQATNLTTSRFIADGTSNFIWDPETKKGIKIAALSPAELKEMAEQAGQGNQAPAVPDFSNPDELAKFQQQYQVSCTPTTVTSATFQPPTDVEFQDLTQMMKMMQLSQ